MNCVTCACTVQRSRNNYLCRPHQQFCSQGFLSCFSCLFVLPACRRLLFPLLQETVCIACVTSVSVWFRSKERPRNDEERVFRFASFFVWSLTLVSCQCLVLCSEANGHDAVTIINNSKRDSCSGCMLLFTCSFIYGFFSKPLRPSAPQRRFNFSTFSLFQYFARIARLSNRGGTGN